MGSPAVRRHSTWRAALSTLLGAAVAALGLALIAARLATGDTAAGLNFPIASGGALAIGGVA